MDNNRVHHPPIKTHNPYIRGQHPPMIGHHLRRQNLHPRRQYPHIRRGYGMNPINNMGPKSAHVLNFRENNNMGLSFCIDLYKDIPDEFLYDMRRIISTINDFEGDKVNIRTADQPGIRYIVVSFTI